MRVEECARAQEAANASDNAPSGNGAADFMKDTLYDLTKNWDSLLRRFVNCCEELQTKTKYPIANLAELENGMGVFGILLKHPASLTGAFLLGGAAVFAATSVRNPADEVAARIDKSFKPFPKVKVRHDDRYYYVESDGMPDHRMMVGITAWQQQVPLPQRYTGDNAWRFPLFPKVAAEPLSAKSHFFRGAIAIAANGVSIFNPIKNDGVTDTNLAGELDEFGGHGGRADDYHYHLAPLHLQKELGNSLPIAYALDGYPIYGLTEVDGSPVKGLDAFNGHADASGNYHYHASRNYPYLNGGFHGEVTEVGGQVDPQPRAEGVRPDGLPLRGAKITDFERLKDGSYSMKFTWSQRTYTIKYSVAKDGSATFHYIDPDGKDNVQTYPPRRPRE